MIPNVWQVLDGMLKPIGQMWILELATNMPLIASILAHQLDKGLGALLVVLEPKHTYAPTMTSLLIGQAVSRHTVGNHFNASFTSNLWPLLHRQVADVVGYEHQGGDVGPVDLTRKIAESLIGMQPANDRPSPWHPRGTQNIGIAPLEPHQISPATPSIIPSFTLNNVPGLSKVLS